MFLEIGHESLSLNQRFDSKSMSNLKDLADETKIYFASLALLAARKGMDPGCSEKYGRVDGTTRGPGAVFPNKVHCRGGLILGKTWARRCQVAQRRCWKISKHRLRRRIVQKS